MKNPHLKVTVVDCNANRIGAWNSETLPIFEPGLSDLISSVRGKNLFFSTDVDAALMEAQLIFLCVGTPPKSSGCGIGMAADLTYILTPAILTLFRAVEAATRQIASVATTSKIVIEKSTVPCLTAQAMRLVLEANAKPGVEFDILSNPEFLAEIYIPYLFVTDVKGPPSTTFFPQTTFSSAVNRQTAVKGQ